MMIQGTLCNTDEIDDRSGTVRLIITFQFDRKLDRRASEHTGLDLNQCIFEWSFGGIIMMSHMKSCVFMQIASQRLALGHQFRFGALDKVCKISISANIHL